MSEPTLLNGDLRISARTDNSGGGNLRVDGDIQYNGTLTGSLPQATQTTPGAVEVGEGLEVSQGVVSWKSVYRYKNGVTFYDGNGAYICVDSKTFYIDDTGQDVCIAVNLKTNGGLAADQSGDGLQIDTETAKTLLGLKGGAYKEIADNSGTSTDAAKIPELGSGGVLNYAVIPNDYIRSANLTSILGSYVTTSALSTTLSNYVLASTLSSTLGDYVTTSALTTTLVDYATVEGVNSILNSYVLNDSLTATLADYAQITYVSTYVETQLAEYSIADHQHTITPVDTVPASGLITLAPNKSQYRKTIDGTTVIGFDATELALEQNDSVTFELLLTMGATVYEVLFGSNIVWLNDEQPPFNQTNTSYLCAFRSYDGGSNWVGAYQGQF